MDIATAKIVKIIPFPTKRRPTKAEAVRSGDGFKYFTEPQIKLIRRTARDAAQLARQKGQVTGVRDWMLIDLLTSTGLREAEAADVRCGDIRAGYGQSALYVRNGKGDKSRTVQIPDSLKRHLKAFLVWKQDRGEPTGQDDHLFVGQRGPWTGAGVAQTVKKYLRKLGLYERGKSAHALRHSYAVELYRQERDLRAVQKQLGHSSVQTTQRYADVLAEDIQEQIKGLWN
ncbi:MAG: tyrosine-type recombinase/integrase [bacterium]|nr:tyrosine-type recombinase/integrase [bacterium]